MRERRRVPPARCCVPCVWRSRDAGWIFQGVLFCVRWNSKSAGIGPMASRGRESAGAGPWSVLEGSADCGTHAMHEHEHEHGRGERGRGDGYCAAGGAGVICSFNGRSKVKG